MSWFTCKCCSEKDAHIKSLMAEVEFLRHLSRKPETSNASLPMITMEADGLLSGQDHIIELDPQKIQQLDETISERDRILSGTY